MRRAFFVSTVILTIVVVLQFYFAALGTFGTVGNEDSGLFVFHQMTGRIAIPVLSLIAFVLAIVSKAGGRTVGLSILPLGLIVVQILLFILTDLFTGSSSERVNLGGAIILGLHAINGLAILFVSLALVRRARGLMRESRDTSVAGEPKVVTPVA